MKQYYVTGLQSFDPGYVLITVSFQEEWLQATKNSNAYCKNRLSAYMWSYGIMSTKYANIWRNDLVFIWIAGGVYHCPL